MAHITFSAASRLPRVLPLVLAALALPLSAVSVVASYAVFALSAGLAWMMGSLPRGARPPFALPVLHLAVLLLLSAVASPLPFADVWLPLGYFLLSVALFFMLAAGAGEGSADHGRFLHVLFFTLAAAALLAALLLAAMKRLPAFGLSPAGVPLSPIARWTGSLDANDLAAMAAMLLPLGLALLFHRPASDTRAPRVRLAEKTALFAAILLLGGTIAAALARGALLSCALACAVVLAIEGRRGRIVLGLALLAALVAVPLAGLARLEHLLLLQGTSVGLSVQHVFTNRLEGWDRALHAIRDFSLAGIGPGAFPVVVPALYPLPEALRAAWLTDAHNGPLQTVLDFGVFGLIFWCALLAAAARRCLLALRRRRDLRLPAAGLLAALLALLLCGVTDVLAAGAPVSAAVWVVLAGIARLPAVPRWTRRVPRAAAARRVLRAATALPAAVVLLGVLFPGVFPLAGDEQAARANARIVLGLSQNRMRASCSACHRTCRRRKGAARTRPGFAASRGGRRVTGRAATPRGWRSSPPCRLRCGCWKPPRPPTPCWPRMPSPARARPRRASGWPRACARGTRCAPSPCTARGWRWTAATACGGAAWLRSSHSVIPAPLSTPGCAVAGMAIPAPTAVGTPAARPSASATPLRPSSITGDRIIRRRAAGRRSCRRGFIDRASCVCSRA
jgi:O-antigen ligase